MLGIIFRKALNKIQNPAHLRRLIVDLIDRETWTMLDADVKGNAYEGLLQKNAASAHSGHRRGHAARTGKKHLRPRLWYRWLLARRTRLHHETQPTHATPAAQLPTVRCPARLGDRRQYRAPQFDEPFPARHR